MLTAYQKSHTPLHIYTDESIYFLTARCFDKFHFWNTNEKKKIFVSVFSQSIKKFNVKIYAWVLLHNHYHCMFQMEDAKMVGEFAKNLHTNSSRLLNNFDNSSGRKVWYQYWDYCIRNKPDFWRHFNYILQNPVKHGLCKSFVEAYNYSFSSNPVWRDRMGEEGFGECFAKYPLIDWMPTTDDDL